MPALVAMMEHRPMYWNTTPHVPSTLDIDPEVLTLILPGDRILDLGCGPGRTLAGLRRLGLGTRHVGLDRNAPALARAAEAGLAVIRGELTALPLADAAFEVGILQAVLTTLVDVPTRQAVLREARRTVTRVLCLGDFLQNPQLPYYRARYETGLAETGEAGSFLVRQGGAVLYQAHHFTLDELGELLARAGFVLAHVATPIVETRSGNRVRGVSLAAVAV
ncbi:class I SAM-dependent methyltransferase [Solidesulfovibrio sp.]